MALYTSKSAVHILTGTNVADFLALYKAVLSGSGSLSKRLSEQITPSYDRSNFARNSIIGELALSSPEDFSNLDILV